MTEDKIRIHPADLLADLHAAAGGPVSTPASPAAVHAALHAIMTASENALRALVGGDPAVIARHVAGLVYAAYGVGLGLSLDVDEALIEWHALCIGQATAARRRP